MHPNYQLYFIDSMKKLILPAVALAIGFSVFGVHAASAATATPAQIIAKSDTAIASRLASLNKLSARISAFKHLTADEKTSLQATVQSSIDAMNTLKTKIDGETDAATLKADYASIAKDYRIYMLVLPSVTDIATTDNALANITTYQGTLASLQTRITTATTAGKDTAALQASHDDATAKLTDAQTQGQAMITAVTALKPDMGDKTIAASNKAAIASAKTARRAMLAVLAAARKDITSIREGLKALKV